MLKLKYCILFISLLGVVGKIVETNAAYTEGSQATLMDLDFNKLLESPETTLNMDLLNIKSISAAEKVMQNLPGVNGDLNIEIYIKFKPGRVATNMTLETIKTKGHGIHKKEVETADKTVAADNDADIPPAVNGDKDVQDSELDVSTSYLKTTFDFFKKAAHSLTRTSGPPARTRTGSIIRKGQGIHKHNLGPANVKPDAGTVSTGVKEETLPAIRFYRLGDKYLKNGYFDTASSFFNKAIKAEPEFADAHAMSGYVYEKLGRPDDAMNEYQEAIRIDAGNYPANFNIGYLYARQGDRNKAVKALNIAIERNPVSTDALTLLGVVYQVEGRFDDAIEVYQNALKINPNLEVAHTNIGNVYFKKGMYKKALEEYENVLNINPGLAQVHNNIGLIYFTQGENEKAIVEYKKAIELNPEYSKAKKNLSNVYAKTGMKVEAEKN